MKLISLSLDCTILKKDSVVQKKTIEYAQLVEKYVVLVPSENDIEMKIAPNLKAYGVGGANRLVKIFKIYILARRLLRKHEFDLVSTQDPFEFGFIAFMLKIKFHIAWHVQVHGDFFSQAYWRKESLLNQLRYFLGRFLIRRSDSIRTVSERTRHYLTNYLKISKDKIIVVPVHTELKVSEGRMDAESKSKDFVFLSMGRFATEKNLPLLIGAFTLVLEKHPEARLRLIGKGRMEKELNRLILKKKLEGAVEILSWTDNVYEEYQKADAYVLSSNYEGWGRVIVEAAACRLPIIMTDVGCAGEFIKNEESGLVVPIGDEEKLASAMVRMIEDPSLCERLSANAYEALKNLPDKEKTLELYRKSWELAINKINC